MVLFLDWGTGCWEGVEWKIRQASRSVHFSEVTKTETAPGSPLPSRDLS